MLDWVPVGQPGQFYYHEVAELLILSGLYNCQNYIIDVGNYGRWFVIKLVVIVLEIIADTAKLETFFYAQGVK